MITLVFTLDLKPEIITQRTGARRDNITSEGLDTSLTYDAE
jgi:hypothetical protein